MKKLFRGRDNQQTHTKAAAGQQAPRPNEALLDLDFDFESSFSIGLGRKSPESTRKVQNLRDTEKVCSSTNGPSLVYHPL